MSQSISTEKAPKPMGLYPHAKRVGNLLFLSGIGPRDAATDSIPGLELDKHGQF
jgi:2-aminomuconate deaminase